MNGVGWGQEVGFLTDSVGDAGTGGPHTTCARNSSREGMRDGSSHSDRVDAVLVGGDCYVFEK